MCLRTRLQSKKKAEKSRLILHPYAVNKTPPQQEVLSSSTTAAARHSPSSPTSPSASSSITRLTAATTTPSSASSARSPAPNHSPNHVRTLATTPGAVIYSLDTLTNDIGGKWARTLQSLPIAGDFPRLAKATTIFLVSGDDTREVSLSDELAGSESHSALEQKLYAILIKLAIYLHDPTTLKSTKDHFWEHHKGEDGEVSRYFGTFLKSCLQEGDNVGYVLKAINQAILAPAIISLKMAIPGLPFKDFGNSWRIKIFISDDDCVDVVHVRREQSFNQQQDAMKFEFVWELRIRMALRNTNTNNITNNNFENKTNEITAHSNSTTELPSPPQTTSNGKNITSVTLQIVEVAFGPNVPPSNKDKVLGDMNRLLSSTCTVTTLA